MEEQPMSDNLMSVTEARDTIEVLEGFRDAHATGLGHFETQTLEAARTIVKAGEVLDRLDREYAAVASRNPRPTRSGYAVGYLSGIDTAYAWLWKALEVPNE